MGGTVCFCPVSLYETLTIIFNLKPTPGEVIVLTIDFSLCFQFLNSCNMLALDKNLSYTQIMQFVPITFLPLSSVQQKKLQRIVF